MTQVAGVRTLSALTFRLTIGDPWRFAKSRDVGCYLGLQPKRSQSASRDPQLGITKQGDSLLRRTLVNCAHYILGPFGPDCDLSRWGLEVAARGGNGKKRAVVAVPRKLAVLLHRLWVGVAGGGGGAFDSIQSTTFFHPGGMNLLPALSEAGRAVAPALGQRGSIRAAAQCSAHNACGSLEQNTFRLRSEAALRTPEFRARCR